MVDVFSVGGLLLALFLVVLNGFFVASEFAFVRIRSTAVDQLVEEDEVVGFVDAKDVLRAIEVRWSRPNEDAPI